MDYKGKPAPDIELTRFRYQTYSWSTPRWVTGIRQQIDQRSSPKSKTLSLFADDPVIGRYRFSALVSDMDFFNMKDFCAAEAALNTVMLAHILMILFRQVLLNSEVLKGGVSTPICTRCASSHLPNRLTTPIAGKIVASNAI